MIGNIPNHKHPLYLAYRSMRRRCENSEDKDYPRYGGRGITVCERWRNSFPDFVQDVGERPKNHSLDRIDNALGYQPGNVQWSTTKQQSRNTRTNTFWTHNGETLCLTDWAHKLGISQPCASYRFHAWGTLLEESNKKPYRISKLKNYERWRLVERGSGRHIGEVSSPDEADKLFYDWVRGVRGNLKARPTRDYLEGQPDRHSTAG